MKIFTDVEDLVGKKTYHDPRLEKLQKRAKSKKITFISIEFTDSDASVCEGLVIKKSNIINYIIGDLEKVERALGKNPDNEILHRVKDILEKEETISSHFTLQDTKKIKEYAFLTAKPIIIFDTENIEELLRKVLEVTGYISFFTAGPNEAKAWLLKKGESIIGAASKIHTDLARGFIRAEVYNIEHLDEFANPQDARAKGIMRVVDRDYIVNDGDVLNIKFKV